MTHERQETTAYTMGDWKSDGAFRAAEGQEIDEQIYNTMLNRIAPDSLPRERAEYALHMLGIPVHAGFLMGEPHGNDKDGQLYMAFGMNDYGKGKHYYYLGLCRKEPDLNGLYYEFDCLNAFLSDRLFNVSEFASDSEAIATAENYEAVLYKYEFSNGEQISRTTLYDPWDTFGNDKDC